eukprot:TRINITY_DN36890_c0_g1_i1.p1 TRINITY_DN36890_c0_g1~~TRINITY_DN36890_c0_g1_i1.p1  ORF type:complete len:293 (+),score=48.80 TRINITY_DN36890_c0_g1_i1:36-914(+)
MLSTLGIAVLPHFLCQVVAASSNGAFGVREDEHAIYAEVQVASLPFERNFEHLKDGVPKRFWIEVGANAYNNVQDYEDFGDGDFVLSFEPLLDKYAYLLNRFKADRDGQRHRLGFQHERGLAFPFAVGCNGVATLSVTDHDMCSSLFSMSGESFPDGLDGSFGLEDVKQRCATAVEKRQVPCISLEHVIGSWLGGREIFFLKVDTQGSDLAIVQSAGKMLDRIQHIQVEATCDNAPTLFVGAPKCSSILSFLQGAGYSCRWLRADAAVSCGDDRWSICSDCETEIDLYFVRS